MVDTSENRLSELCLFATSGLLRYSHHYTQQILSRPTPNRDEVQFLLCYDAPEVIEDYLKPSPRSSCLIWGTTDNNGRIAHVVCVNPPEPLIITAYFPAETEPNKWQDNYRRRIGG